MTDNLDPYKNLAVEKFLTFHTRPGECILYLWQNRHTVVIGKNQNCWKECHISLLEREGGRLARRLSGGGAVFHDMGNINFTFCVREPDYNLDRQLEVILKAVGKLGIKAVKTGRNDITVEGRKISGNAFFESGGFCYHHGTILLYADKFQMSKYLNVSKEKLKAKGVDSVKSRVANLSEFYPDITAAMMAGKLKEAFGEVYGPPVNAFDERRFDKAAIARDEAVFGSWEWKYGKKTAFEHEIEGRFEWGGIELKLSVKDGVIQDAVIYSDAMACGFISEACGALKGSRYNAADMRRVLKQLSAKYPDSGSMADDIGDLLEQHI